MYKQQIHQTIRKTLASGCHYFFSGATKDDNIIQCIDIILWVKYFE